MNTNYIIYIHTDEKEYKEYKEHWYGLAKAIDRVGFLKTCYNVKHIDIVDACTDEVMITIENGKVAYIAAEVALRMYNELIANK